MKDHWKKNHQKGRIDRKDGKISQIGKSRSESEKERKWRGRGSQILERF
jgi:hypothetical protein